MRKDLRILADRFSYADFPVRNYVRLLLESGG